VLRLLAYNPFPRHPPKFVRAIVYDYRFADWKTHRRTGAWWKREPVAPWGETLGPEEPTVGG
jgi:hypothetical protein